MPKDPANNIDRYKIDGGELNEYEFQSNQEELSEPPSETPENLIPGTPPEISVPEIVSRAQEVVQKRAKKRAATTTRLPLRNAQPARRQRVRNRPERKISEHKEICIRKPSTKVRQEQKRYQKGEQKSRQEGQQKDREATAGTQ